MLANDLKDVARCMCRLLHDDGAYHGVSCTPVFVTRRVSSFYQLMTLVTELSRWPVREVKKFSCLFLW